MKKILFIGILVIFGCNIMSAQGDIWGKGRYLNLSYAVANTAPKGSSVEKGKFGFALTKGTTYLFPKKPFFGMLKVGFDINWMDVTFAKYNSAAWENSFNYDYGNDDDDLMSKFNLGRMSLLVGVLGVGPNVTVAPFANMNNAARFLKASLYFHYQPTFGIYMVTEDGDLEASYAYCNMFQFGGKIQWKFIGLGIEGHWGSGNFKQIAFENEDEYGDFFGNASKGKYTRKFANTRIYLSLSF